MKKVCLVLLSCISCTGYAGRVVDTSYAAERMTYRLVGGQYDHFVEEARIGVKNEEYVKKMVQYIQLMTNNREVVEKCLKVGLDDKDTSRLIDYSGTRQNILSSLRKLEKKFAGKVVNSSVKKLKKLIVESFTVHVVGIGIGEEEENPFEELYLNQEYIGLE